MKRIIILSVFLSLLMICVTTEAQVENVIYGKTVTIKTRDTSSAELKIINSTRNVAGYLKNIGGGLTRFTLPDYNELINKPTTFTPSAHTHGNADITDLAWSKITGAPSFISSETDPVWTGVASSYWLGTRVGDSISVIRSLANTRITQTAADARYLQVTGGTLTGNLNGTTAAFSSNVGISGFANFGGSSGGANRIYYDVGSLSFIIRSDFDTLRIQGGADNGSPRDIVFYIGNTRRVWIPRSSQLLTADYTLTLSDNSKAFATTEFVKGQGYLTNAVTSVGLSLPSIFSVSGSPVTSSGTLNASLVNQSANLVFASPSTGSASEPTFRSLVNDDLPIISVAKGGTGLTSLASGRIPFGQGTSSFGNSASLTWDGTYLSASNFLTGGRIYFGGGSGGSNDIRHDGAGRFIIKSDYDILTFQGGINDANKRQIDFWTGLTQSAYIDNNGVFWKSSGSTAISTSDNSLKFATTAFVKDQGYITSSALSAYVAKSGDNITGSLGFGVTPQADAKIDIDGGDLFVRNGYSLSFSSGTSGSSGNGATMIGRAVGNLAGNGYAEFLAFYAGQSAPYTAPIVLNNGGGNVLIGTTTNQSGYKLQVAGKTLTSELFTNTFGLSTYYHASKLFVGDVGSSFSINVVTEFPSVGLVSGNGWGFFGKVMLLASSGGGTEVREFFISKSSGGSWSTASYGNSSGTTTLLSSVTGSGNTITINMSPNAYATVELTAMVR